MSMLLTFTPLQSAGAAGDGLAMAADIATIVVGVASTAVGLALAVRIKEAYGTVEEDEIVIE